MISLSRRFVPPLLSDEHSMLDANGDEPVALVIRVALELHVVRLARWLRLRPEVNCAYTLHIKQYVIRTRYNVI